MDIRLLMHNEVALVKLNTQLQTSQFSTINHATGTGKSFIGLKYAYQNKDKRILYLTPTYLIFHQLKKHMKTLGISLDDFKKFDHIIYRNLMNYDMEELVKDYQCDFISQEDYLDFKEKYLYEINRLNLEKEEINNRKIKSYDLKWIDNFRMNQKLEKLDRNIIENFIDNIYVYNDKSIDIKFKFKNEYEEALSYLKNEENMV